MSGQIRSIDNSLNMSSVEQIAAAIPEEFREIYVTAAALTYANAARGRIEDVQTESIPKIAGSLATNDAVHDVQLAG